MSEIDEMCAEVFLKKQGKLFDEKELRAFWREEGIDDEEMEDASEALEVFVLPDGRYLYVEG